MWSGTFLPFGQEWNPQPTVNHYKFTGKERDTESGLDNFGARYDSSQYGRFMTPDPMLNSGRPSNPQTWNRYTYAQNNPLVITDPTGLYNNIDHCGDGDKQCEKQLTKAEEKERKNVERLTKAVDKMKDGPEKARFQASLKAFGTENDENNVYVSYGGLDGNVSAQTGFTINPTTGAVSFNVAFDPGKNSDMAIDTAHEGTHITNKEDPRYNNPATTLSAFSDEYRAYQSSAWAASALGLPSLSYGGGEYQIWNSSWAAIDDKVLTRFITDTYKYNNGQHYDETTPHTPWVN